MVLVCFVHCVYVLDVVFPCHHLYCVEGKFCLNCKYMYCWTKLIIHYVHCHIT